MSSSRVVGGDTLGQISVPGFVSEILRTVEQHGVWDPVLPGLSGGALEQSFNPTEDTP